MKISVPEYILSINPYKPGKPLDELEREYGIKDSIKLASNENPLGPSPMAIEAIRNTLGKLNRYPDGSGYYLVRKLSEKIGVGPGNVVLGNGSDEIISMLTQALLVEGDEAIMPVPSFLMYDILVKTAGAVSVSVPLKSLSIDLEAMKDKITPKTKIVFITNPNNPTGTVISRKQFDRFLKNIPPEIVVVIDEAYIEFVRSQDCLNSLEYLYSGKNVVILRTFSKAYGLAGMRIGYGIMPEEIAELLNRTRLPFNTSSLAQVAASAALDDNVFLEKTISLIHNGLDFLYASLDRLNVKYYPGQANFFLIDVEKSADDVFKEMLKQGVIVRSMASYCFPEYIRINVGLHEENIRFLKALERVIL